MVNETSEREAIKPSSPKTAERFVGDLVGLPVPDKIPAFAGMTKEMAGMKKLCEFL